MTHRAAVQERQPPKFVRRIQGGKYEYGIVVLGDTRPADKYVRVGVVGTYEEAANASQFAPAVAHAPYMNEWIL